MIYREKLKALSSLCDIQTGYTARTRLEPTKTGGVPAIQLRDLRGEDEFDPAGLPLYELAPSIDRYWARPGDVLFRSRGERNTAVLISEKAKAAAVAVLPLIVLRPRRDYVDPGYVAWFINQPDTQRYFDKCALGTNMRMIPKDCLHALEVAVPDLATQRRIVEIDSLARRERALTHELAEKKFELARAALLAQARQLAQHTTKGMRS
jgi:hypothetical protein